MDRIATSTSYSAVLANMQQAQSRMNTAAQQYSSGYKAPDLKGYASQADALIATKTVSSRLDAYVDANSALSDKLDAQAQALDQLQQAGDGASKAVLGAIANGDGTHLMEQLQGYFEQGSDALNTNYEGQYLFAGGVTDKTPVAQVKLADLPTLATPLFQNGTQTTVSRLDDNITLETGITASDVGQPLMDALKGIATYVASLPGGKLSQPLSDADVTALKDALVDFKGGTKSDGTTTVSPGVSAQLIAAGARNGTVQSRLASEQAVVSDRSDAAKVVASNISDADPAQAVSDFQLAQVAIQASAQVFSSLQNSSLLNLLSSS